MIVWATCLLVLACCQLSRGFTNNIYGCQTARGAQGFCRPYQECAGFQERLQQGRCPHNLVCCPRRAVSERKCHEYAQAVFSRHSGAANFLPHSQNGHFGGDDECNIQGIPLIIGGEQAQPKEFPHMAAIGYGNDAYEARWVCGGSLISENFVVTAAHCTHFDGGLPIFVKFGVVDILHDYNPNNLQVRELKNIYRHPQYKNNGNTHDIALLELSSPVVLTPFVRPACLDFSGQPPSTRALASGWGITDIEFKQPSQILMKVQLDIADGATCRKKSRGPLDDSSMCYGAVTGTKDTCRGDSGGPMQAIRSEPYCTYTLLGVTQSGNDPCGAGPAPYTRVFTYLPWIESVVWPHEY